MWQSELVYKQNANVTFGRQIEHKVFDKVIATTTLFGNASKTREANLFLLCSASDPVWAFPQP